MSDSKVSPDDHGDVQNRPPKYIPMNEAEESLLPTSGETEIEQLPSKNTAEQPGTEGDESRQPSRTPSFRGSGSESSTFDDQSLNPNRPPFSADISPDRIERRPKTQNKESSDTLQPVPHTVGAGPSKALFDFSSSRNRSTSESFKISQDSVGLWGMPRSGKTTFITLFCNHLDPKWKAYFLQGKKFNVSYEDDGIEELDGEVLDNIYTSLIFNHRSVERTSQEEIYVYHLEIERIRSGVQRILNRNRVTYPLQFVDAAGAVFREHKLWRDSFPDHQHPIDILKQCRNIICLIDAQVFGVSQQQLAGGSSAEDFSEDDFRRIHFVDLSVLLRELQDNARSSSSSAGFPYNVAFCISKADIPHIWEHQDNIEPYAERILGSLLMNRIKSFVPEQNRRWFAISAYGPHINDSGEVEQVMVSPTMLREDHVVKPHNLFAPIEWFFENK